MKRCVKSSSSLQQYTVEVSFCGFVGSETSYTVQANSKNEAAVIAQDMAKDDLEVLSVVHQGDDEYDVTVGFNGLTGVEETYSVYGDSAEEAEEHALEEAYDDLLCEI